MQPHIDCRCSHFERDPSVLPLIQRNIFIFDHQSNDRWRQCERCYDRSRIWDVWLWSQPNYIDAWRTFKIHHKMFVGIIWKSNNTSDGSDRPFRLHFGCQRKCQIHQNFPVSLKICIGVNARVHDIGPSINQGIGRCTHHSMRIWLVPPMGSCAFVMKVHKCERLGKRSISSILVFQCWRWN